MQYLRLVLCTLLWCSSTRAEPIHSEGSVTERTAKLEEVHPGFSRIVHKPVTERPTHHPQNRFLSPEALTGLSQLFVASGTLSSCYSCSASFPIHAESCCSSGFTGCCLNVGLTEFGGEPLVGHHRPGTCPWASPNFLQKCSSQCFYDTDCPGEYKCCAFGCSLLCARPVHSVSPTSAVKPGYCPAVIAYGFNSFGGYGGYNDGVYGGYGANNYIAGSSLPDLSDGNVLVECLRDADCPGIRKCCGRSGYQRRCALPLSVPSYGR